MNSTWEWIGMVGRTVETNEGKGTVVGYTDDLFVIDLRDGGTVKRPLCQIKVIWTAEEVFDLDLAPVL